VVQLVADFNLSSGKNQLPNISELVQKQVLSNPPCLVLIQGALGEKSVTMGAFITQKLQQSTDESGSYESCYSIPWSEHSFIFYCEVR